MSTKRNDSMAIIKEISASAIFSDELIYRYYLDRQWDKQKPTVSFIMLNPSTATEEILDPTVKRCYDFAHRWGYGKMCVCNIFALRATNPKEIYKSKDPIGDKNDYYLVYSYTHSDTTILAWGEHGNHLGRGKNVYRLLAGCSAKGKPLYCLKTTKNGQPMHPLYIRGDTEPVVYSPPKDIADFGT